MLATYFGFNRSLLSARINKNIYVNTTMLLLSVSNLYHYNIHTLYNIWVYDTRNKQTKCELNNHSFTDVIDRNVHNDITLLLHCIAYAGPKQRNIVLYCILSSFFTKHYIIPPSFSLFLPICLSSLYVVPGTPPRFPN